jgi:DNA primase
VDFVDQLKSSIDIVNVIGEYVRLRKQGATGRYTGLCPFHQEKTPSFNVNQTRQFYKCFGCGASGDALKFVMEHDGMTFPEALRFLAERNGIPMPQRSEYSDATSRLKGALREMHAIAAQVFQENLRAPQGAEARAYLERRAVSSELIAAFQLGYADPSGQQLMRRFSERGFTAEQLDASGLVRKRTDAPGYYDVFRGRLMFPIHDESGKVIAFGGRAMRDEDQPKYYNSPETPIYRKTSILYNLHRAREGMRRTNRAVLVEGYMDVIGVYAAGVKEAVASCGTALTNAQVRAIRRHADTVIVNFDPDTAGANAAERAIQLLLDEGLHVRVLALDSGGAVKLDPDEYVKRYGAEAYAARLEQASGYFHWLADRARARFDMRTSEGRVDAFKFLLPAVNRLADKLERAAVANDLASYLGVEPGLVLEQFRRSALERRSAPPAAPSPALPPLERMLLQALLNSERARAEVLPALQPEMYEGFVSRAIFESLQRVVADSPARLFGELEGRLGESDRALLHLAVSADDTDEEEARRQAEDCLRRLEIALRRRHLAEAQAKVKVAEREGRMEEWRELTREVDRLKRELHSVRATG